MASRPIYQFYAELEGCTPKIWRRFQVMDNITIAKLGYIIQVLFEMRASHLMAIEIPQGQNFLAYVQANYPDFSDNECVLARKDTIYRYEIIDEDYEEIYQTPNIHIFDATTTKLHTEVYEVNDKLNFNYDFGDNWWVTLTLENIFRDEELHGSTLPLVLEGGGFGIVEDVGGVDGLEKLAIAFKKKTGEDYTLYSEWLGIEDFDIHAFDLDDMNFRLKKIPRIYKQCYEDRLMPTQKSIDLIERNYLKE